MKEAIILLIAFVITNQSFSQTNFNGLNMNMGNLYRLSGTRLNLMHHFPVCLGGRNLK
jgi:hypothetical protein